MAYGDQECGGCASFAHDPSFTHDAVWDLCPHFIEDVCAFSHHELAYRLGMDEAHYSVPMIVVDVDICAHDLAITNHYTDRIVAWFDRTGYLNPIGGG